MLRAAGLRRPARSLTLGEDEDASPHPACDLSSSLLCPRVSAHASRAERSESARFEPRGPARQGVTKVLPGR